MTLTKESFVNMKYENEISDAIKRDLGIMHNRKADKLIDTAYTLALRCGAIEPKDVDPYVIYGWTSDLVSLIKPEWRDLFAWFWNLVGQ